MCAHLKDKLGWSRAGSQHHYLGQKESGGAETSLAPLSIVTLRPTSPGHILACAQRGKPPEHALLPYKMKGKQPSVTACRSRALDRPLQQSDPAGVERNRTINLLLNQRQLLFATCFLLQHAAQIGLQSRRPMSLLCSPRILLRAEDWGQCSLHCQCLLKLRSDRPRYRAPASKLFPKLRNPLPSASLLLNG